MRRLILAGMVLVGTACSGGGSSNSASTAPVTKVPVPGSPNSAVLQGAPLSGKVGGVVNVSVKVVDSASVAISGIVVNFVVTAGGGSVFAPAVQTSSTGIASEQWTLGTLPRADSLQLRWIDPSSGAARVLGTLAVTAVAGPVSTLVSGSSTLSALTGTAVRASPAISVEALDRYNNPVAKAVIAFAIGGGGGSLSGPTIATTDTTGVASFAGTWTLGAVRGQNTLFATATDSGDTATPATITAIAEQAFTAIQVTTGQNHACALVSSGAAYCWGWNNYGQLGDGTTTDRNTPVAVQAGGKQFTAIAAGANHTCGLVVDGTVLCWGRNSGTGALGDGTFMDRLTPVASLMPASTRYVTITAGSFHTCAITVSGGAYCWGEGTLNDLGSATVTWDSSAFVQVTTDSAFKTINANASRVTCAVTVGGVPMCWGWSYNGALGPTPPYYQVPTVLNSSLGLTVIVSSASQSCGVDRTGAMWCWGTNSNGQLGNGTQTYVPILTPVQVPGLPAMSFPVTGTNAGTYCGLARTAAVYCWGVSSAGLGARQIGGVLMFASLSAGQSTMCGLTTGGVVMCSGNNSNGQLGNGTTTATLEQFVYVQSP